MRTTVRYTRLACFLVAAALTSRTSPQSGLFSAYGDPVFTVSQAPAMAVSPTAIYLWHDAITGSELIKTGLDGAVIWSKRVQIGTGTIGAGRIIFHNGALYLTGAYQNAGYRNGFAMLDTAGTVLWATELDYGDINTSARIHPLADGFLLVGHRDFQDISGYSLDITLVRLALDGSFLWGKAHSYAGLNISALASVVANNGDVVVAGYAKAQSGGNLDARLWRFDSSGDALWSRTLTDGSNFLEDFQPGDLTATSDGHFALCGTTLNSNSNYDAHVLKFDDNGLVLWAKRLYQIGWYESARGMIEDASQRLVVNGYHWLGTVGGPLRVRMELDGDLVDAIGVDGLYVEWPSAEYTPTGTDLAEFGAGYLQSTQYRNDSNEPMHALVTTDDAGAVDCAGLASAYPIVLNDVNWTNTPVPALPGSSTAITGTAGGLSTTPILAGELALCPLITAVEQSMVDPPGWHMLVQAEQLELVHHDPVTGIAQVRVLDASGRLVLERAARNTGRFTLWIGALNPGTYVVEVNEPGARAVMRFVR